MTPKNNGHRTAPRYLQGHSSRDPARMAAILAKRRAWVAAGRPPVPTYVCQCGCGEVIPPKPHHRWSPPTYLPGHYQRVPDGAFQRGVRAIRAGRRTTPPADWVPPSGVCECGCGGKTQIATRSKPRFGQYIGYPLRFIYTHNNRVQGAQRGVKRNGGRYIDKRGYASIWRPEHSEATKGGYALEHRVVYADTRGVTLPPGVLIHHINGITDDNRPENLVATSNRAHRQVHIAAGEIIGLFLDDKLLEAATAHVREQGTLPDLEALTADVYGHA